MKIDLKEEKWMVTQILNKCKDTGNDYISNISYMKYFPGRNALYKNIISGSRAHDKIHMVHRKRSLMVFKAVQRLIPNLPSPPFLISMVAPVGSSFSLTPLKATKPSGHKGTATNTCVTSFVSLCPGGAFNIY
jgi:hypothetical protein